MKRYYKWVSTEATVPSSAELSQPSAMLSAKRLHSLVNPPEPWEFSAGRCYYAHFIGEEIEARDS